MEVNDKRVRIDDPVVRPKRGKVSSQQMTAIGSVAAGLAFLQFGLPDDTPQYVELLIGTANAGLSFYLGKTNKGTR